jgi:peptidoglycan/LPS O-acetylase OafA/YrhL
MTAETSPAKATTYPERVAPLIGLQFIAIAWVVLNQFRFHLGLHASDRSGLVFKGYLGAELFFVLTGFLVCRLYAARSPARPFSYGSFQWAFLARTYPVHLAMIAVLAALGIAAAIGHAPLSSGIFDPAGLAANLLLIHAWGVLPTVSWNFPSWLISATWFAYLVFPATAWIALKGFGRAWLAVLAAIVLFSAAFEIAAARGVLFSDMTAQIGALQTIPAFLLGAGLYRLGAERDLPPRWGMGVALAAAIWIVAAASLRLSDLVLFPAFGALVYGLAETSKSGRPALGSPIFQRLGELSLTLMLVYLPVDIVYFHSVKLLLGQPTGPLAWVVWAGVFPVILAAAVAVHHAIEKPAFAWLSARDPFAPRKPAATATA